MRRLRCGFVVYRFSYEEIDTEWNALLEKLNEGLGSGWEDVIGSERIRGKASLHRIDGREKGIAEEDLGTARTLFDAFKDTPALLAGVSKTHSLDIAPQCLTSFLSMLSASTDQPGDYRGFLQAISVDFFSPSPTEPLSSTAPTRRQRKSYSLKVRTEYLRSLAS
ncbi:hypothetical protein F5882DRAFT_421602 [Hyaloscypha sp. PMI_1271]|nr:hypothetical protein F5882DRAFT_421602 [Hyaloscypha sp. PMI_1271]